MAAWTLVPILALTSAGLSIESLSPDALCPPQDDTQRAVADRLGRVELEGTWRATYVLVHRTRGDFVSLKLFDPFGALKLTRELPVQSGSCAALSEVIALVLERFFLRTEALTEAAPSATPATEPAIEPSAPEATTAQPGSPALAELSPQARLASTSEPAPSANVPVTRPFLAGAELWAATAWLAPSLRFERDWNEAYRLGASAGFDLVVHQASAFEGTALSRRAPFSLMGSGVWKLSSLLRARASLQVVGVLEMARTRALARAGSGVRLVPGLGARVGAEFFPASAAQPFIELTATWLMGFFAPAFEVAGHEVLKPPGLVLGMSFGLQTPF